ncbi:MAG TPA: AAA family ATPase [Chitinophagaceae bacterium]|jgi:chromosome partitioning protein|nr:AAA family ATPase [Chitinophagaceae bacterium]
MSIISILIPKGGTGKTMTSINLAAALQQRGQKVLLVDMDPQANMSQALGIDDDRGDVFIMELEKAMNEEASDISNAIVNTRSGLSLVPSSRDMSRIDYELVGTYRGEETLKRLIGPVQHRYDFIFIDCPSAWNQLTQNAVVASDFVLMPLQAETLPAKGIESFYKNLEEFKRKNNSISVTMDVLGLVLTKYDEKKKINRSTARKLLETHSDKLFDTRIRWSSQLANAQSAGLDIFSFNQRSTGAKDYDNLAVEFLHKFNDR